MIMILTGKCFEDFVNFRLDKFSHVEFIDLPILLQNALIIEFFDTSELLKGFKSFENTFYIEYRNTGFIDRKQATQQAIIHSNKIYNETKV